MAFRNHGRLAIVFCAAAQVGCFPALGQAAGGPGDTASLPAPAAHSNPALLKDSPTAPVDSTTTPAPPALTTTGAPVEPVEEAAAPESPATPANAAPLKPADRPAPPGLDAAVKLYGQGKWALAQKELQKFVKAGTADVSTHGYLAYCLYQQRQYGAAQKEFEWVSKYSTKNITLQRSAQNYVRMLGSRRSGVCPGSCIKASDPRWERHADGSAWLKFPYSGGYNSWSSNHIGEVVVYEHGKPVNKGRCNLCGGTGKVPVLKDGMAPPT